jgi:hypothetical protein
MFLEFRHAVETCLIRGGAGCVYNTDAVCGAVHIAEAFQAAFVPRTNLIGSALDVTTATRGARYLLTHEALSAVFVRLAARDAPAHPSANLIAWARLVAPTADTAFACVRAELIGSALVVTPAAWFA